MDWFRSQREFTEIVPVVGADGRRRSPSSNACSRAICPDGEALFPEDYLTDQPERRLAAEIVREQVLAETRDELPFTTAVVVDGFEEEAARGAAPSAVGEEPRGLIRVFCSILVERASQKPMLIGRGGAMVKRIGTAARLELQRFFGTRVFLDLQVKVAPDWRENERVLDDLGLERPRRAGAQRRWIRVEQPPPRRQAARTSLTHRLQWRGQI